jgi:hypothetical protein
MVDDNKNGKSIVPTETYGLPDDLEGLSAYAGSNDSLFGFDFLRVNGKTGRVNFGRGNDVLPTDARLVALIGRARVGFIHWENGQLADQAWLSITQADDLKRFRQSLPKLDPSLWLERDARGRPRDPYRESARLPLVWIEQRLPLLFTTSSDSGVAAVKTLLRNCIEHGRGRNAHAPVVQIAVDSYQHPSRSVGEIFYPIFELSGDWLPPTEVTALLAGEGEPKNSNASPPWETR